MQIITKAIDDLIPYEKNPRKNDAAVKYVANSIKEFGFKVPIVIDKGGVIIAGHTRYKAAQKLKLSEVPCIVADDLSEEQVKAFRLADNKVGERSKWDKDALKQELDEIFGINMSLFDFGDMDDDFQYSPKVNIPQYEPTGAKIDLFQCYDADKYERLISDIDKAEISEEEKRFLSLAATRHVVFDYTAIAEYYANATPEMQKLMEENALVIIDYQDAIRYGYAEMMDGLVGLSDV